MKNLKTIAMKISIKREQSQICLSFAERKKFAGVSRRISIKREQGSNLFEALPNGRNLRKAKKYLIIPSAIIMFILGWVGCSDFPVDEDGLLITERSECYVSNFELLGADFQTVRTQNAVIDTTAQTIDVEVFFGTDLKNLYPQFSLVTDAKLDPKITGKVDFSDLANPKQWTVVSGNRQVRKTYTVFITVQQQQ